jgi:hypothetical protein
MRSILCTALMALATTTAAAFANDYDHDRNRWGDYEQNRWGDHDRDRGHEFHGAPGPIAGAGLPFFAVGFGVYWLVTRRRKAE